MRLSELFLDIPASKNWESVDIVSKGWSSDEKYMIRTIEGELLLLRISDIDQIDAKKKEYEIITKYSKLGIHMSTPREFGICNNCKNVYMLLSWVEGRDLEEVLPGLSKKEQYILGREAGKILRKIHSIPIKEEEIPETTKKEKKLFQLLRYENSQVRILDDEIAIEYVKDNINLIWKEIPVYMHGDFHPGNLIYRADGSIGVIDFNRWEIGDPYEEFYKLESFGIEISVPYCIGQIDAYFDDKVPNDFWITNAVYVAQASLFSIKWAEKFGQEEIDGMVKRARTSFGNYDNFRLTIPQWYTNEYRKKYFPDVGKNKKIMIIGSPGSGKSTFARKLREKSGLPLFHLDMMKHKPDRTEISSEDFDVKLKEIFNLHEWIIDGNYQRTLEVRMKEADLIILFDLPTEVCLEGAIARIGTKREDLPWVETEDDFENGFRQWIEEFSWKKLPEIYALLENYKDKDIVIFKCRKEADNFAQNYGNSCVGEII